MIYAELLSLFEVCLLCAPSQARFRGNKLVYCKLALFKTNNYSKFSYYQFFLMFNFCSAVLSFVVWGFVRPSLLRTREH